MVARGGGSPGANTNFRKDVVDNQRFNLETLSEGEKPERLHW